MEHHVNKLHETLGSNIVENGNKTYLHRPNIPLGLEPKPSIGLLGETEKKWKTTIEIPEKETNNSYNSSLA